MAKQNKPAPEETGAELKKESTVSDVMNANENAEFSKTEDKATEGRVSNNSVGDGTGSSNQTADADIAAREQQLEARENELKIREESLVQKEDDLKKASLELEAKAEKESGKDNLNSLEGPEIGSSDQTADADIAAREKRLAEREKEVALREEKVSVKEAEVLEVAKPAKAVELTFEGEKYVFDKHAPQSIRVDDVVYTQKEIAKNEEVLLSLIGGNSSLIKKL